MNALWYYISDFLYKMYVIFYYWITPQIVRDWIYFVYSSYIQKYILYYLLYDTKYFDILCKVVVVLFVFFCFLLIKNANKICRFPKIFAKWHKTLERKYFIIINVYRYGGAVNERKYDREAFAIEEQIFQQCVPPKALNKYAERKNGTIEDTNYEKLKSYSAKFDLPFRERYT